MSDLGYAHAHDTSIEERYEPVPLLKDKVIVLSGVGPGLGRALGEEAARLGADLVLASRTASRLEKMAAVVEKVAIADVPERLPYFTPITPEEYAARIAARQRSVARRMLS